MAFCTNCGGRTADDARFCPSCGQSISGGGPPAVAAVEHLDYTIQGSNLQVIRLKLKPGQEVYAEAGKMVYKTSNVIWETRMSGSTLGEKIWGALKRKVMG